MAMGYASERMKKEFMYCAIRDQQVLGFEDLGGISGCHQQSSSDFCIILQSERTLTIMKNK